LNKELQWAKTQQDTDNLVATKIKELVNFIADDEILGKDRFNNITDHLRPPP
jgi:hypothetical protein